MMFGLTGVLSQIPAPDAILLLTFHDGSIIDLVTPSRVINLDANAYVGYPYRWGAKYANTSLIVNNKVTGLGCYCTDLSGLTDIGSLGVNYTIEFWASGSINPTNVVIRLLSGANVFFNFAPFGTTAISITFHNQSILGASNALLPRRSQWNHFAFIRSGNTVIGYVNGVQTHSSTMTSQTNVPITAIQLGFASGAVASNNSAPDLNINYFAISNKVKYNSNFDPNNDTGFIFYSPQASTEYCI